MTTIQLAEIAHARSGDKGSDANVGVIAYSPAGFELLCDKLTESIVAAHFAKLNIKSVERFELPKLGALNFLLRGALGEGGSRSLRIDAQGKALGAALLELELDVDADLIESCRYQEDNGNSHD